MWKLIIVFVVSSLGNTVEVKYSEPYATPQDCENAYYRKMQDYDDRNVRALVEFWGCFGQDDYA